MKQNHSQGVKLTIDTKNASKMNKSAEILSQSKSTSENEGVLKSTIGRMKEFKNKVDDLKQRIKNSNIEDKYTDLVNQQTFLSRQIQELERENSVMKKFSDNFPEPSNPDRKLDQKIKELKAQHKELLAVSSENQRILKKKHEKVVHIREKIRKFKPNHTPDKPEVKNIKEEDILTLEEQIKKIKLKTKEKDKINLLRIQELKEKISLKQNNVFFLNEQIKQIDYKCRSSVVKIRNQSINRRKNIQMNNALSNSNPKLQLKD